MSVRSFASDSRGSNWFLVNLAARSSSRESESEKDKAPHNGQVKTSSSSPVSCGYTTTAEGPRGGGAMKYTRGTCSRNHSISTKVWLAAEIFRFSFWRWSMLLVFIVCHQARSQWSRNASRSIANTLWALQRPAGTSTPASRYKPEPKTWERPAEKCGLRPLHRRRRITGGRDAKFGDWPWQVSVMQRRFYGFPNMHRCGGALLNANWVVTSAHCVHKLQPSSLRLRLGELDFSGTWEPSHHEERGVARIVVHFGYDSITLENDVALLKLSYPVTSANHMVPLCMPFSDDSLIGRTGFITGWGRLKENGALPPVLQEVSVRIISNNQCEAMFRKAGHDEHLPDLFLCTDYQSKDPSSHCQGDSGGPLQVKGADGRWFLAGIISWGISCSEPDLPAVYIRISRYKTWLQRVMA